jgi:SAM-dependent methyltransferase
MSTAEQQRLDNERSFHNRMFATDGLHAAGKVTPRYLITKSSTDYFQAELSQLAPGKHVLEYGCGVNSYAIWLAKRGATVVGIDISDEAVAYSRQRADAEGVSDRVTFIRMNAEALAFPAETFGMVCGRAILHHLDLAKSYSGLARVMKPDAHAVFIEPMGYNPLINMFRDATPDERTPDEHPFKGEDFALTHKHFANVKARYFHLTSIGALPLHRFDGLFRAMVGGLDAVDQLMFKIMPPLGKLAWSVGLTLSKPRILA